MCKGSAVMSSQRFYTTAFTTCCQSVCLPACLPACPLVSLSAYLPACLPVSQSVSLFARCTLIHSSCFSSVFRSQCWLAFLSVCVVFTSSVQLFHINVQAAVLACQSVPTSAFCMVFVKPVQLTDTNWQQFACLLVHMALPLYPPKSHVQDTLPRASQNGLHTPLPSHRPLQHHMALHDTSHHRAHYNKVSHYICH